MKIFVEVSKYRMDQYNLIQGDPENLFFKVHIKSKNNKITISHFLNNHFYLSEI